MEARNAPKFVHKMRRWLSRSRSTQAYAPIQNSAEPFNPGQLPFLELPREIRDMVYRELLLDTHPLVVHLRRAYRYEAGTTPYHAILRTNKQIHDEAAAVFYGENTWFSAAPIKLFSWADDIYDETSSTYVVEASAINMYLPWIKRFVLFADGPPDWMLKKIIKDGNATLMLKRMGIERDDLKQLIIGVQDPELLGNIMNANREWLEEVDETEMEERFGWFTQRKEPAFWLVSKEYYHNSTG
ncbi:hypothetical protein BU23DRAFT_7552 [Bimuria novae-zelandiae CBS 107.79]|uniref:F-box domain-containing protein n=1 Tax=Bimuria novae-zelandiae CBS 107.79 TaxID=1447943 RepID=A0A6A5VSZ0_9PLEO|nr:hypothetical protein BU23DRAFT_7552 [Bimuria novae-zelandiae CBS 107.79]